MKVLRPPRAQMMISPAFFLKSQRATLFKPSTTTTRYRQLPLYAAPTITAPSTNSRNTTYRNARGLNTRPTRLIVVDGYGCDILVNRVQSKRNLLLKAQRERKKFTYVDVICNDKRSKSMTRNIVRRIASSPNTLGSTPFVREVAERVQAALARGERVTLVGYSYGGSVVSRVAMMLSPLSKNIQRRIPNLKIVTFGSIFIPNPASTQGVNIQHYAYENDIARMCHKRNTKCPFVKFLKPKTGYGALKSHLDYTKYIMAIATTGSTNINKIVTY